MHLRFLLALAAFVAASPSPVRGDLLVTEFMAANKDGLRDEDGDSSDWIELFNSGAGPVELEGHFLTDDPAALTKWRLPRRTLAPNGFAVVFASGKDRAVPGAEMHASFALAATGDFLALVAPDGETILSEFAFPRQYEDVSFGRGQTGSTTPRVLVAEGAACRRLAPRDGSVDAVWTAPGFDDSRWPAGTTGIGYENGNGYQGLFGANGDVSDELTGGAVGVYLRVPFDVANPASFSRLTLGMKYDDGFVAFLNGVRVTSGNAPANPQWDSFATGNHDDGAAVVFEEHDLTAHIPDLKAGRNVLAVHLLNTDANSSDLLVVPELRGIEITEPSIGGEGFLATPSPGTFNGDTFEGFVADTKFSVTRGFFDEPFDVAITTETPDAVIRYTLDGSAPTASTGTVFTAPIRVARTTVLRAAAFKTGLVPTNVDTQTYVFVDDVVEQDAAHATGIAGLPSSWGGQAPDYGMDPRVTQDPVHRRTIRDDLKSVPTLSIVMDADDMFGGSGIYSNPGNRGSAWERATSLELIDPAAPDGSLDFQVDCAIRIQGGAFRSFGLTRKKSFRVLFKSEYGPSKLRYPFFGPDAAQEFDTLTFRMEANDGYQWDNRTDVQYARDEFGRRTQLDMGWPAGRGRYMHLYINGVYWGVYNTVERPDAAFGESYLGADKDEWDGLNNGSAINEGNTASWNTLDSIVRRISSAGDEATRTAVYLEAQGLRPDGTDDPALEDFINVDNYIDYLLVNWYGGNADWPHNNWYAGRARGPESTGFHFFMWDAEWSLFLNSGSDRTGATNGVATPYGHLRNSLEFRTRFGDRAHRALFNDGPLTPQRCVDRWVAITRDHPRFLVGELARWGDQHGTLRTMDQWRSANARIRDSWMATRTPEFVEVLRGAGLYPEIDAPVFSRHGGSVSPDTPVTMATNADTIYYTLDGSDPRLLGGAPSPSALVASFGGGGPVATTFVSTGHTWRFLDDGSDQGVAWRAAGFDDASWESGPSPLGYGGDGEATTVSFGPDSGSKFATTYYRTTVEIPDPSAFLHFLVRLRYDDAAAVYLNGEEIIRTSNLPANAGHDTYATSTTSSEGSWFDFTFPTSAFAAGTNTLAVEVHQASGSSSDTRMDLVLRGEVSPGGGANQSDPLFLVAPAELSARSFHSGSGEWSALNTAFFTIDTVPAGASNLVVSEIHYRPADPVDPAELAVSADRDAFEFIELMNIADQTIDLSGVRFREGIVFAFPPRTLLGAGERLVLVRNAEAFGARYPGVTAFAEFDGGLDSGGETILLVDPSETVVRAFAFDDEAPWPSAPDGDGFSLVLVDPSSNPDHADPSSWRPSVREGGSPGTGDGTTFGGGAPDELIAHALGAPASAVFADTVEIDGLWHARVTFPRNAAAEDAVVAVEYSEDLVRWRSDAVREAAPQGLESWRSPEPLAGRAYWRVRVSLRE